MPIQIAHKPRLILKAGSREYWLRYEPLNGTDLSAGNLFVLYASEECDDYLGEFDTRAEALAYAKDHAAEEGAR